MCEKDIDTIKKKTEQRKPRCPNPTSKTKQVVLNYLAEEAKEANSWNKVDGSLQRWRKGNRFLNKIQSPGVKKILVGYSKQENEMQNL